MSVDYREHHRRSIRLKGYDHSSAGGYSVTLNAFRNENLIGEPVKGEMSLNAQGEIAKECWEAIPAHFPDAEIDVFVIMPNHMHGIIFIFDDLSVPARGPAPRSPGAIVGSFKSTVSCRTARELTGRAGIQPALAVSGPRGPDNSAHIWHRNYYEHITRDQSDYERIAVYILANPANWAEDRNNPYQ